MASRVISAVLKFTDQNFSSGLRQANREAGEFGRYMQQAQNSVENFNTRASNAFRNIGVAAGALASGAIAGLGVAVGTTMVEMEESFAKLAAQTGASGEELEKYKDIATETFSQGLGESVSEVADAVGRLSNMFGDLSTNDLSTVTEGTFTIAKTFNQEATEVGRAVNALMKNFDGLSASDATDLVTVSFQKTGDYANDLLDTFSEYSGYFADIGMSAEQFTSTLINGAEAGAFNIDKVGDAVKEFGILSIDGSKSTAEGFKAIGLNADDMASKIAQGGETANQAYMATIAGLANMDDEVARNKAGVALFGTQWEDLRDDVVLSMSDSTSAVEGYQGATQNALDTLNSGSIARIKNAWRDLVTQLSSSGSGTGFLDSVASAAEKAVPVIVDLANKAVNFANVIKNNWGPISTVLAAATAGLVAFKVGMAAMNIINTVVGFIKAFRAATVAGTAAQWAMNVALSANPIGIVIGLLAGLVAAGVALYMNWDTVKAKAGELWSKVQDVFGKVYDWGAKKIGGVTSFFSGLVDKVGEFIGKITNFKLPDWVSNIGSTIGNAASKIGNLLPSFDVGTNRVASDMTANIHKDEMIIPARQAQKVRAAGGNIDNIDKLINKPGQAVPVATTTNNRTTTPVINMTVNANQLSYNDVVNRLSKDIKLALSNM